MKQSYLISEKNLSSFCVKILMKYGMSKNDAVTMSCLLVKTDKWGINTHGTKNLFGYVKKAIAGGVSFVNQPKIVTDYPSLTLIDANNCMGFVSSSFAMNLACEKAKNNGIAMVVVKNSSHYGAGACYANIASEKGYIGICISNVDKKMTIPGSKGMVMGHNPFTLSAPAGKLPSIFLDASSSNVSSLKVIRYKLAGESIPNNWIVDKDGCPTTDPSHYPDEGALLPVGGHKGYGIALFIDILTGIISSSLNSVVNDIPSWCFDLEKPNGVSHTFIAINQSLICRNFVKQIDELIDALHNLPKAKDTQNIFVPGEIEWNNYKNCSDFIKLPKDVAEELLKLSEFSGIKLGFEE